MTTRDAETLAQLVHEQVAGEGKRYTNEQLANRSVDPETGYKPSPNLVWSIASGKSVKINPPLVRALAAGLGLSRERVGDAARRQFIGWYSSDPSVQVEADEADDDVVYRVAAKAGVTPEDMPAVKAFYEQLRKEREGGQE
jgi:hypothetical protein